MTGRNFTGRSVFFLGSVFVLGLACAALLMVIGSCSSDSPPATDTGTDTTTTQPDTVSPDTEPPPLPDVGVPQDQYVWPDTTQPADTWPHPSDAYSSTPFGCTTDADCFGQKCCPTPWGVKLCSPSCS